MSSLRKIGIHFGTFDYYALAVVGPWAKLQPFARRHLDDKTLEVHAPEPEGYTMFRAGYPVLLWIPKKPRSPRDYGVLTHECMHLIQYLFNWVEMPLNEHSQEAYCHAIEHAVTTILRGLK